MLKTMRKSAGSPFIKLLLTLLVLSFISFYGFNRAKGGCNTNNIATVNGESIGLNEFTSNFKSSYEFYRKLGLLKSGEDQEEVMNRLKELVLDGMIESKIKIQEAKKLGLTVSDLELADNIKTQFTDPSTKEFNEKYYEFYLRQNGMASEQFEEGQRERLLVSKLDEFIKSTAKISPEEVIEDYKNRNESLNISFVKFDPKSFATAVKDPSTKELEDFYSKNKDKFKPEQERKIEYIYLAPEDFVEPSDSELKTFFADKFEKKSPDDLKGERIRASHILLKTEKGQDDQKLLEQANEILKKIKAGEAFEKLASIYNPDGTKFAGGDLGYFGKGKMVKEFEAVAFNLKTGELSNPVKTSFGYHIIKVTDKIPEGEATFDRLRKEVSSAYLSAIKYDAQKFKPIGDKMNSILASIKSTMTKDPKKQLAAYKSKEKIHWGESGFFTQAGSIDGIPDSMQIVRSSFGILPNETSDIISGFFSKNDYLVKLKEVKDSKEPVFDSIKERVKVAYKESLADGKAKESCEKFIEESKKAPAKFESIAKSGKLVPTDTGVFKRNPTGAIPLLGSSTDLMAKVFSMSTKDPILNSPPQVIDQKYYAVKLKDKTEADMKKFETEKASLVKIALEERQREFLQDWVSAIKSSAKIKKFQLKETQF